VNHKHLAFAALASVALLHATTAHAHFKLLEPASWLNEDAQGGPQKGSPCGPGNTRPFIGDDVQPIPASDAVTTFEAGATVTVKWQETVYHPGYFRISIARTAAADATSTDFPDPPLTDTENCHYDNAAVETKPHGDVLADGLFMASDVSGTNRSLEQDVKLPDEPCDHCTLQVVQVMEGHPASSCFYFHCADIKIAAKESGSAGKDGGSADGGGEDKDDGGAGKSGGAGKDSAGPDSGSKRDDGGCAVARGGSNRLAADAAPCVLALALILRRRRAIDVAGNR
jgi:hypothetical protein